MESAALSVGLLTSYFGEASNTVTEVKHHEFAMHNGSDYEERFSATSSSSTTLRKSDSDSDYEVEVKFENGTGNQNENSIQSCTSENESAEEETIILDLDSTTKEAAAMSKCSSAVAGTTVAEDGMYLTEPFRMNEVSHYADSYFEYDKNIFADTELEPIGCNEDTDELIYMKKEDGDKPYKCSECPSAFKKLSNLKVHLRIHTGETPFRCLECPASFKSAGNLKVHMRIHTGEKPYQCPECSSAFARACDLKKHKITHTKEKPFTCCECCASFTVLSNLRRHMKIHVGDGKIISL